jgi:ADP-ribosyl-[dinitrogen reductase] hydrolase
MLAGALYGAEAIPERWLERLDPEITRRIREQVEGLLQLSARDSRLPLVS